MKKLGAIAILLASFSTIPAIASPSNKQYISAYAPAHVQVGKASWYGRWHAGRLTANGERFNPQAMTCAHRTLPLGSVVKVTNVETGQNVALEVNDRGPYVKGRILDLSEGAANELGVGHKGIMLVRLEVISEPGQPS
jgi:rare lipoprotein A